MPVGTDRVNRIALQVRSRFGTVEHVVGRDVQERDFSAGTGARQDGGAVRIGLQGRGPLGLGAVYIGVSRGIDHKRGSVLDQRGRDGSLIADVGLRMCESATSRQAAIRASSFPSWPPPPKTRITPPLQGAGRGSPWHGCAPTTRDDSSSTVFRQPRTKKLYLMMHQSTTMPSRQLIFLPSAYVRPE